MQVNGIDIKARRLRAGIRQYDLAARIGIYPSRLSEIEAGRRRLSPELLEFILEAIEEKQDAKAK